MAGRALTMSDKPVAIAIQTFKISPQRVYDAILDPAMIARFMFGLLLRQEEILHIRNDPRVGGEFSFKVRRGDQDLDHVGVYLELTPPTRITFTWAVVPQRDSSTVSIDIMPTADGCSVRLTHAMPPEYAEYVDRARGSWENMLGVLATLL
jgi:uncharacterized protein YndB with AHSA1/START domain